MKKVKKLLMPIAVILLLVVTIIQFTIVQGLATVVQHHEESRVWDTKLLYACYNYKIQPCDDNGVTEWNKNNPEKAITKAYLRDPWF